MYMFVPAPASIEQQYTDNIKWIREAGKHKMVNNYKLPHNNSNIAHARESNDYGLNTTLL